MRAIGELDGAEPEVVYGAEREAWSGATLDWGVSSPALDTPELTNYDLGFGGAVIGGALDMRYRGRLDGRGLEEFDARWQGVWPDQASLRQLELGSTRSTGPRGRAIDGISLGNAPFLRSSRFGETVLRGRLDPGWEVEVYRNGRLIDWQRVDDRGTWEFSVPLDYGQNPVEIRAYGPNGEVRITERAMRVDFDRIPGGTFEYGLSAGRTDFRDADFTGNADLRYGFNRFWTARAGYEGYELTDGRSQHHPYAGITGSIGEPLRLGAERVVDAWWRGATSLEPNADFRAGIEHYRYDRQGTGTILTNPGDRDRTLLDLFWRPWRQRRGFFLDFDAERLQTDFDRTTRTAIGMTTRIRGIRTSAQLKEEWHRVDPVTWRSSAIALQGSMVLRSVDYAWWHGVQVRLQGEIDTGGGIDDWVQLQVGRRVGQNARLEFSAGWFRVAREPMFTLSLSSTGTHAYVNAWANRDARGGVNTRVGAEGSVLYNPERTGLETYPLRSLGRGGLSGTVFIDANANGIYDTGERAVPGVRLVAGELLAETDEFGRYSVWNLVPFEAADIQLDRGSLGNPLLVPVFETAAVAVSPNGFRRMDLPLIEGVELEGVLRTRQGDALHCPGKVPLKIVQIDGDREYSARCFSDGEFYLIGVVPGTYRLIPDPDWLAARGLRVAPDDDPALIVEPGEGRVRFELILEPTG
jgi:hypothetical protein